VDVNANFGALSPYPPDGRVVAAWLDDRRLLTVLLPAAASHDSVSLADPRRLRRAQWGRTEHGRAAVTVWDSRRVPVCGADNTLVLLDVENERTIPLLNGAIKAVSLSPNGRFAAVTVATATRALDPDKPAEWPLERNTYAPDVRVHTALRLVDIARLADLGAVAGITDLTFLSRTHLPRWSPDSGHIAIPVHTLNGQDDVYWVGVPQLDRESFHTDSPLDAEVLTELLVLMKTPAQARQALQQRERFSGGNLQLGQVPGDVIRLSRTRVAVIQKDHITILDTYGRVTRRIKTPDGRLVLPRPGEPLESRWLLFNSGPQLQRVAADPAAMAVTAIAKPSIEARLAAVVGGDQYLVYVADRDDGSDLSLTRTDGREPRTVMAINQQLRGVVPPAKQLIRYKLPTGEPRIGLLLLPPDYVAGRRYPAIINVYPGVVFTPDRLSQSTLNGFSQYTRTLLAAAGYVVLYPSIPIPPGGDPLEISALIAGNVLPAANALVEQGLADAARLGLYGHSYGGYSVLALAARSDQFHAIVASASFGDLISYHDQVYPEWEMLECAPSLARYAVTELEAEDTVLRMRAPPLSALDRYLRNSPYFGIQNVRTPILFLHGELDPVPDAVAERMFVALDRRNIPVKLARYWGEGHNLQSPDNIRHSWAETVDWFETFLRRPESHP
ncbi:MAG: prolyl oligopeptidase family serine peptidase, partial [Steroidobacteraceae bacterium]